MHSLDLLSLFRDSTNDPINGHGVFLVSSLAVLISLPPTRPQCISCRFSHRSHRHPLSHNVFFGSTLTISRYNERPTQLRFVSCMFSHQSHHHPPNHNVFLGSTLTVSRYTERPTQLQCTPCRLYRRVNLTTTHQVTMYPSDLLSLF